MKAYLDSGVFLDYLITEDHPGASLRATKRRGRAPERLRIDAEKCLTAIQHRHTGATSTVTCWELEEAMYGELVRRFPEAGVNGRSVFVPAARLLVTQTLIMIELFRIELIDLRGVSSPPSVATSNFKTVESVPLMHSTSPLR